MNPPSLCPVFPPFFLFLSTGVAMFHGFVKFKRKNEKSVWRENVAIFW